MVTVLKKTNLLTSILLGDDLFQRHAAKKKTGNVDLKMGPKIWTPFWGPPKEKQFGGPQNRVQILHPTLGST